MPKKKDNILVLIRDGKGGFTDKTGKKYSSVEGTGLILTKQARVGEWRGKKQKDSYEGGQYRGGKKGRTPNLIKTETGFINKHGVEFTKEERKALESSVNRSNRIRLKQLEKEGNLPRLTAGKDMGDTRRSLQTMGTESDFIITRQSKSLHNFHSKEDFFNYLKKQQMIHSGEYLEERTRLYKRNHIEALENVFGDDAKDVMMKIRMMKPEKYREMIQKDEFAEITYIYDPSDRAGKLNQIRAALGMKLKEEEIEEE